MTPSAKQTAEGVQRSCHFHHVPWLGDTAWGWVPGALCRGGHKLGSEPLGTGRRSE